MNGKRLSRADRRRESVIIVPVAKTAGGLFLRAFSDST
jgi:hypothetical protein